MINRVVLVGRITRDPELKYTSSNIPYVQFTLAVNRTYQSRDGNREADFIACTAWRAQAENLSRYIKKGALLGVEGSIQVNSYDDQGGVRRTFTNVSCTNIQFLEPRGSQRTQSHSTTYDDIRLQSFQQGPSQPQQSRQQFGQSSQTHQNPFSEERIFDDSRQQQQSTKDEDENPFAEVGNFDVSNDDLPF